MYKLRNEEIRSGYDEAVRHGQYREGYEFIRWFIRPRNRAEYAMTYQAIIHHIRDIDFSTCLELGPGPGTWTRLLYRRSPEASFTLIDISEAMREQFRLEMRECSNVLYTVRDIMQYDSDEPHNLFFSSRAVEYLEDKPAFFAKLPSFIRQGGQGVIVTKNPFHGVRKSKEPAHQGQISMVDMERYLRENGFVDIRFYPVVFRIPILSRFTSRISEYLARTRQDSQLDIKRINRIVESYLVTFRHK